MYQRSLTEITDDTLRLLRDYRGTGADGKFFTWQEVLTRVKRTVRDMVVSTGVLKGIRSIIIQEGVYVYSLPNDCIRLLRASVNGLDGRVILPVSRGESDYKRSSLPTTEGTPETFFRDILPPDKIGFVPGAALDGSTFSRDSLYGLIRQITDGSSNLPYDSDQALRDVDNIDIRLLRSGDGYIIRDLLNPFGNIQVTYVRIPEIPEDPNGFIDSEIPEFVHKDIKYGATLDLLRSQPGQFETSKRQYFEIKWYNVLRMLQRHAEHKGILDHARPV